MKKNLIFFKIVFNSFLLYLPSPKNLSFFWNIGSILGIIFIFQILTGIFLTFYYTADFSLAFNSLEYIIRISNYGFFIRWIHINFASFFFLFIYIHIFRGLYYFRFKFSETWNRGVLILIILIIIAFLGYVLPWGQISFWAATVITKFFSVIPILGPKIVNWVWGGFSVFRLTLKFFFSLHFLFPFILIFLIIIHLLRLHFYGRRNPAFIERRNKQIFSLFFIFKDLINLILLLRFFFLINIWFSSESVNFIKRNPVSSPAHIKPEWYFLFAYAILRSVPNKLIGVLIIGLSLILFFILTLIICKINFSNIKFINSFFLYFFICNFIFLRWIGGNPVTDLFVLLGIIRTIIYFIYFKVLFLFYYFIEEISYF